MADILNTVARTIEVARRSRTEFLKTELEASEAFLHRALSTHDTETRRRNQHHARVGYETLVRMVQSTDLVGEREPILQRIEKLRSELEALGEVL